LKPIGIIANPASGKDIRRLVTLGSVFDNVEKTNIVKRVLKALDALGVKDLFVMPDSYGIGRRAFEDVDVNIEAKLLEMEHQGTAGDSQRAAEIMAGLDVACIITLGGDGTNRVVAKACGDTPLLPISIACYQFHQSRNNGLPMLSCSNRGRAVQACAGAITEKAII